MIHKLLSARLMEEGKPENRTNGTNGSDAAEGAVAAQAETAAAAAALAAASSASRTQLEHVPLNSSLSQIVNSELSSPQQQQQQIEDQLHQLRLQQQQRLLVQQAGAGNAFVDMLAKTLAFGPNATGAGLSAFGSSVTPSAALLGSIADRAAVLDRASLPSLRLQQLLAMQHAQQQLLQQRQLQAAAAVAQPTQAHSSVVRSRALEGASTEMDRPEKKRRREVDEDGQEQFDEDDDDPTRRFRPYQSEQWTEKFQELCDFRKAKGHCQVPHTYAENPPLARWVKRQRYQYKLKSEKRQSTMTDERIDMLEKIGFIWDSHAAAWAEKLNELKDYAKAFGTCNVPSTYPENPQLATWVKCQRRQYKLLRDGKTSNMTKERISELQSIGFEFVLRASSSDIEANANNARTWKA